MNRERLRRHRLVNGVHTVLLLAALGLLVGVLAWRLGGTTLAVAALALLAFALLATPRLSPAIVLRAFRAAPLDPRAAPGLDGVLAELARRAALPAVPRLWYVPSDVLNAFAVGRPENAAIALSDGLLRRLEPREIAGVLAHEVAHLANGDLRVLGFADLASRVTGLLAQVGIFLAILNLPLVLLGVGSVSWWTILLLLGAPLLSTLAQLALARTREYDADAEAARLLGDPRPLISALHRLEVWKARLLDAVLLPPLQRLPDPSLLRTHPPTEERLRRLLELAPERTHPDPAWSVRFASPSAAAPIRPRFHRSGLWF